MARDRTMTEGKVCARCGATLSSRLPRHSCAACLLETALGSEEPGDQPHRQSAAAILMDFGDYELLEEIGRGGQGVVFRARQKSLNRTVALKVIGLGHWATEAHIRRFRLEAEAAASLDHPQIVPIYEIGERDGACYFSMKCIDGGQLDQIIGRKQISIRQAAGLIAGLARTVHYAHERGILHRDIKPGNILLDADDEPHLTDFGLARLVEGENTITRTIEVLGTPSYIAPEQAAGGAAQSTRATDVYGLGAVFYQLLTGQPPFAGGTTFETIRLVLEAEPRHPRLWNPKIDRDIATICLKCLEKDPAHRYSSALALAEDLERWQRHEPIQARRAGPLTRGRKWLRRNPTTAILTSLLITLIAVLATSWQREKPPSSPAGIAVLPFDNLSGNKEDAVFADGIQDDLLTKLAKIAGLKVISRTSVLQYRGMQNTRKIGQALNVSYVLEGSVRKSQGRIRLNAQLIDARSDQHVWAEQYDRDLTDIFAIQSELAQNIASQLSAKITRAEKAAIETKPTQDLEAYELYLRAKSLNSGFSNSDSSTSLENLAQGVELLEKAVQRDPNFALAYDLLTHMHLSLYWIPGRADSSRRSRAEAALRAAQRLAPDAGETHLAQALFYHYGNRDYDHALAELDVAARLLPNDAAVFRISALIERRLGRWADSLRHFSKAIELDPRDRDSLAQLGLTRIMLRQYTEAEQIADRAIARFPGAADQFWDLKSEIAVARGNIDAARAAIEKVSTGNAFPFLRFRILYYARNYEEAERFSLSLWQDKSDDNYVRAFGVLSALAAHAQGATNRMQSFLVRTRQSYEPALRGEPDPSALSEVGKIDAGLDRREEAIRESRRAIELRPIARDAIEGPEYAMNLAVVYAWIGDQDHAIEQLARLAKVPNGPTFGDLKLDPLWDAFRNDPRFATILADAAQPVPIQ